MIFYATCFLKEGGTTPGGSEVLPWTPVGTSTSYSGSGLSLENGKLYYLSVRAFDANNTKSQITQFPAWETLSCPAGFIKIPGNTTTGLGGAAYIDGTKTAFDTTTRSISDFCVMKYEAKLEINGTIQTEGDGSSNEVDLNSAVVMNGSNLETNPGGLVVRPASTYEGKPWVWVERSVNADIIAADGLCALLGPGFQLINNSQWQAIARDIESVSVNFDTVVNAALAQHSFNRGHSSSSPAGSLAADSSDANGCAGLVGPAIDCGGTWHINKRTHQLSNGEVIWDLAGNVDEWVRDDVGSSQGSDGFMSLAGYNDANVWGTLGDYTDQNGSNRAGLGMGNIGTPGGAILRGGTLFSGANAGIFNADLAWTSSLTDQYVGFRCTFAP